MNEKMYSPEEVARKVLDHARKMYMESNLYKSNTAHEVESGEEPNNDDAECPESLCAENSEAVKDEGKKEKKGKSSTDSPSESLPNEDSEADPEPAHEEGMEPEEEKEHDATEQEEDEEDADKIEADEEEEEEDAEGEAKKKIKSAVEKSEGEENDMKKFGSNVAGTIGGPTQKGPSIASQIGWGKGEKKKKLPLDKGCSMKKDAVPNKKQPWPKPKADKGKEYKPGDKGFDERAKEAKFAGVNKSDEVPNKKKPWPKPKADKGKEYKPGDKGFEERASEAAFAGKKVESQNIDMKKPGKLKKFLAKRRAKLGKSDVQASKDEKSDKVGVKEQQKPMKEPKGPSNIGY